MPDAIRGAWRRTREGYRVTLAVAWPEWHRAHVGGRVGFDLIINEMLPGRVRRAGQLVWSGGDGWGGVGGGREEAGGGGGFGVGGGGAPAVPPSPRTPVKTRTWVRPLNNFGSAD